MKAELQVRVFFNQAFSMADGDRLCDRDVFAYVKSEQAQGRLNAPTHSGDIRAASMYCTCQSMVQHGGLPAPFQLHTSGVLEELAYKYTGLDNGKKIGRNTWS